MPSSQTEATLRLIAHLPDAAAGRFHFTLLRRIGDRVTELHPTACEHLFPEVFDHIPLHGADEDGVPGNVLANAWYHCAGVFYPGEPYADHIGQTEAGQRLRRLLRMDSDQYSALHTELQLVVDEFDSPRMLHARLSELIDAQRLRWRREAVAAVAAVERAMQELEATPVEVAA